MFALGHAPPSGARDAEASPFGCVERADAGSGGQHVVEALGDGLAGLLDEEVAHQREELDDVPVGVDDRMVDPGADLGGVHRAAASRTRTTRTGGGVRAVVTPGRIRRGPALSSMAHADVAQLVEHHLAKVRVAGSNPVVRSKRTS